MCLHFVLKTREFLLGFFEHGAAASLRDYVWKADLIKGPLIKAPMVADGHSQGKTLL